MRTTAISSVLFAALLAACGGTETVEVSRPTPVPPPDPDPISVTSAGFDFGLPDPATLGTEAPVYSASNDTLLVSSRITANRSLMTLNPNPEMAVPASFKAYWNGTQQGQAVRGVSPSGASAYASRWQFNGIQRGYERPGTATFPTTGGATFSGTYFGVLGEGATQNVQENAGLISGTAELTADFDNMRMSGEITNRINGSARAFAPLTLMSGSIRQSDGSFGSTTSGGIVTGLPGFTGAQGTWSGLLAGTNAAEVVGTVGVTHTGPGKPPLAELGAFVATRQ